MLPWVIVVLGNKGQQTDMSVTYKNTCKANHYTVSRLKCLNKLYLPPLPPTNSLPLPPPPPPPPAPQKRSLDILYPPPTNKNVWIYCTPPPPQTTHNNNKNNHQASNAKPEFDSIGMKLGTFQSKTRREKQAPTVGAPTFLPSSLLSMEGSFDRLGIEGEPPVPSSSLSVMARARAAVAIGSRLGSKSSSSISSTTWASIPGRPSRPAGPPDMDTWAVISPPCLGVCCHPVLGTEAAVVRGR